jgi:prepilin-type N-terminal cleavage/methylation domain-containing protein
MRTMPIEQTMRNRSGSSSSKTGFTLIELLIVVGIIAILALVAVPNFLEAQTRAKVAAVKNDLRVLAGSLEAYAVDNHRYPPATGVGMFYIDGVTFADPVSERLVPLTTPIAYLSSIPKDRIPPNRCVGSSIAHLDTYDYFEPDARPEDGSGRTSGGAWRVSCGGPDLDQAYGGMPVFLREANMRGVDYDPTNGSVSNGDLVRVGALHTALGDPNDPNNPNRPGIVRVPTYREQC